MSLIRFARQFLHQRVIDGFRPPRFTSNADEIRGYKGFYTAAHKIRLVCRKVGINDRIRYPIADLIRMAF